MKLRFLVGAFAVATEGAWLRTAPDVAARVAEEQAENLQIHDGFASQEEQDVVHEKKVKADKDLSALLQTPGQWLTAVDKDMKTKMLVQVKSKKSAIVDPCANIPCASNLKCPAGFQVTAVEGHCCDYCVNPDIKVEAAVTGATGEHGGKASTFCDDVWCFPTMCAGTETNPSTTNGQCCPQCSS